MSWDLRFRGTNRVRNGLRRTAASMPKETEKILNTWGQGVRKTLKGTRYPPELPRQVYVRTGRLANSWAARIVARNTVMITNTAKYVSYVVGDIMGRGQAWMHKRPYRSKPWWLARPIVDAEVPKLRRMLTDGLTRLGKRGLK